MKSVPWHRYPCFFAVVALGLLADLATKSWAFAWLGMPGGETWWLWKGRIGLQTSLNEGALFGLGQGWMSVFVGLSAVAAAVILYSLFWSGAAKSLFLTITLACITAGIFGNLYDRLGAPGLVWNYPNPPLHRVGEPVRAVRDWIRVVIAGYDWPNFNIADSLLVCGCGLLIWQVWTSDRQERDENSRRTD